MRNKLIIGTLLGVITGAIIYAIAKSDKKKIINRRRKYWYVGIPKYKKGWEINSTKRLNFFIKYAIIKVHRKYQKIWNIQHQNK